ncbi:hypothetical protein JCM5296_003742 [Sporobolomyces johnsonii]
MTPQSTVITPISISLPYSRWDIQRNLSIPSPPFSSGSWTFVFTRRTGGPTYGSGTLCLAWSGCEQSVQVWGGRFGCERKREGEAAERVDTMVENGRFPPKSQGRLSVDIISWKEGDTVQIELELQVLPKEAITMSRTLDLLNGPQNLDVCLVFPREGRRLWASSKVLAEVSPYWQTQLASSGFREHVEDKEKSRKMTAISDDSDDELDDNPSSPPRTLADSPPPPPGTRTIPITGTMYQTYRALLCWLYTGQLQFAPLTSTFLRTPSSEADLPNSASSSAPSALLSARRARLSALSSLPALAAFPSLSPPVVSPKSLYRLSHFLEIPTLKSLCLAALRENLTLDNVAREMLGSFSEVYAEVWDLEIKWARNSWASVRAGEGMKAEGERMRRDGATSHEVATLLRLDMIWT